MTFEDAFREINGRMPTPEEVKHALAMRRVIKESDLDPVLLVFLADAQAQAAREQGLRDLGQAFKNASERVLESLPSHEKVQESITGLRATKSTLEDLRTLGNGILTLAAVFGGAIASVWVLTLMLTWTTAYARGRDDVRATAHRAACEDLSGMIAGVSGYWRKMGYPAAGERLGHVYDRSCM